MNLKTPKIPLQIKKLGSKEFEGHGSVFGNVDLSGDVVLPGAFKRTLSEQDSLPPMFWMHDASRVPGKWLEMSEDDKGLYVKGQLADTDLGAEVHTLLKMEAVRGMSIGYITRKADYDKEGNRLISDVDLMEVSIVSIPMNPKAQIALVKSRLARDGTYVPTPEELVEIKRECEEFLRSKGFGRRAAIRCASDVFDRMTDETFASDSEASSGDEKTACATPMSLEVDTGISDFNNRIMMLDLENAFNKVFKKTAN